jgi:hypothetical protein
MNNIIKYPDNKYKAYVTNSEACKIINQRLRQYPKGTDFLTEQSEGIFIFNIDDLAFVTAVMKKFSCLE